MMHVDETKLEKLIGKTIVRVSGDRYDDKFKMETECGLVFKLFFDAGQYPSVEETVYLEEIVGDLQDLLGAPVIMAEEVNNADTPDDSEVELTDSFTWTFYRIATKKGLVVLRFLGESNGYYAESVTVSIQ